MTQPLIDVIMLVHSQSTWADLAIRAVEHHTKHAYRLILVDQASGQTPNGVHMAKVLAGAKERGHTVIHLPENRSFSNGINAGVRAGDSKFIVLLNDDALVTEGWDGNFIQDLTDKNVGLVGARSNYAGGVQSNPAFTGEPPFIVFVCAALRRKVWDEVGPLDEENFDGFSTEDVDYSWRVKKAGLKLKVSNAFVLHAGSRSLVANFAAGRDASQVQAALSANNEKYNRVLHQKWGKDWVKENSGIAEKVLVMSYHAEEWTRVSFMGAFAGLKRSDGVTFSYHHMQRAPIHIARQIACDYALDSGFDVLVQLDDDATFPPDTIRRLLSHQKEVVCALAYQRKPPHGACIFEVGPDGVMGGHLEGWEHTGLRKVDVSGYHCSVLRTSVIKKLRDAGIRQYFGGFENKVGEDFAFSLNLKKIGVQVYCDTELISGHLGAAIHVDETYKRSFAVGQVPPGQK